MINPRLTVCLTFDVDGLSAWIGSHKSRNPSMISRGEFTVVATPRVLQLLRKYDIAATFCVPGHTVCAFPDLVRMIRDGGHEIAHHGWVHENPANFDREGEHRNLKLGLEALATVEVRPVGYRSPAWNFSENTIDLLQDFGFEYDSSCMGHDFHPYYLRNGDQWSLDAPYQFGQTTELLELPVTWGLDDYPVFEHVPGGNPGNYAPSAVEEVWWSEFDYAYKNSQGGLYTLTMHPEFIGRGHRITLLERLIQRFKACDGVSFATLGDYAKVWRAKNPLEQWKSENPLRVGSKSLRSLSGT
jgi:peptidoglycan/xylan/chitin deacetylase (PgdA/CDA1 family)